MPLYQMLSKMTERGRGRVRHNPDRILEVNREVEERGMRVLAQYALMGRFDFATILEAQDDAGMHRLAIALGARDIIETETMPAFRVEDFIEGMRAELAQMELAEE